MTVDSCLSVYHITKHCYQQFLKARQIQPRLSLALPLKTFRLCWVTRTMNSNSILFLLRLQVWSTRQRTSKLASSKQRGLVGCFKNRSCHSAGNGKTSRLQNILSYQVQRKQIYSPWNKQNKQPWSTSFQTHQINLISSPLVYITKVSIMFSGLLKTSHLKTGKSPWEIFR